MRYDSPRRFAPFPRIVLTVVVLLLVALTATAATKKKARPKATPKAAPQLPRGIPRYTLTYSLGGYAGRAEFIGKILEVSSGKVIAQPGFSFTDKLRTGGTSGPLQWTLDVVSQPGGGGKAVLSVMLNGREVQRTNYTLLRKEKIPRNPQFDGEPISLTFVNASLRDVLGAFNKLTKVQFNIDKDVAGTVSMDFQNVHWDEALDKVITTAGYQWKLEGGKLHVFK